MMMTTLVFTGHDAHRVDETIKYFVQRPDLFYSVGTVDEKGHRHVDASEIVAAICYLWTTREKIEKR